VGEFSAPQTVRLAGAQTANHFESRRGSAKRLRAYYRLRLRLPTSRETGPPAPINRHEGVSPGRSFLVTNHAKSMTQGLLGATSTVEGQASARYDQRKSINPRNEVYARQLATQVPKWDLHEKHSTQ
jgi:hypothetical protein